MIKDFLAKPSSPDATVQEKQPAPSNLLKCVAHATLSGKTGKAPKMNQDNLFIAERALNTDHQHLFGVCDGHGASGRQCSLFVKNRFQMHFQSHLKDLILEETKATLRRNGHFANFEASGTRPNAGEDSKQGVLE